MKSSSPITHRKPPTRGISNSMGFMGYAPTTSTVTINNQAAYRFGEFYHTLLGWTNSAAAVFQQVTTVVNPGATTSTYAFIPLTPEAFSYDADGNLLFDGRWDYTWNGENQLTVMQTHSSLAGIGMPLVKLEFAYDYVGRRCQKKAYLGQGSTGGQTIKDGGSGTGGEAPEGTGSGVTWTLKSDTRYIWDGWNLIAELNGLTSYSSIRTYAWGLDLSGSEQGAGGISGMAFETDAVTNTTYHPCYDGNGNLMSLRTTGGVVAAGYEYGPFGESLLTRGDYAPNNPFQFSTKYADAESGLLYYGYRYYNASAGRWLGRDPLHEAGGYNLLALLNNDSIVRCDFLGLDDYKKGSDDPKISRDPGAGTWNSKDWTSRMLAMKWAFLAAVNSPPGGTARLLMPDAFAHLEHYFGNSGADYTIRLQAMVDDVPRAKKLYNEERKLAMKFVESLPDGTYDITSGKAVGGYNTKGESKNWYYAVGGYSAWGKGTATVCGGQYTLEFEYKLKDWYNWDAGKAVTIQGVTITDSFMGEWHRMGLAQEFDMNGSIKETVVWGKPKPASSPSTTPPAPAVPSPKPAPRSGPRG